MKCTQFAPSRLIIGLFVILPILAAAGVAAEPNGPPPPGGKVLVPGAPIHGANGIIFDGSDRLHIASVLGQEILIMNPQTGKIIDRLGLPDMDMGLPDDLIFGPDGSLYWTSPPTGEVNRLSPEGVKTTQVLGPGANPITFSDDGRLFVSQCFQGDVLFELDPNLVAPPRIIRDDLGPGCGLNGMDWFDGFLYGPRWFLGEVVRVEVDSGEVTTVAESFGTPAAVKFDSQGRLHVLDTERGEVVRVDTETGDKEVIAQLAPGLDNLAFDSHDRLLVSSFADGSITQVLPSGQGRTVSKGGLITPGGVAVLARPRGRDSVFVADVFSLPEFDGRTGRARSAELSILGVSALTTPLTVAPDGDKLVLSSWFSNAVQVWDPETSEVVEEYLDFDLPINAIRFQGDLVVAEFLTGSVVQQSATTGERVALATGLIVPAGLAATDDDLWVGDWFTGIVWQVVADGVLLATPTPVATGLSGPEGLAVDGDKRLFVVEAGAGRLSRIDLTTGVVSTVAADLALGAPGPAGALPTWIFNGVAVSPSGTIYVTGDIANVLYRFRPHRGRGR